MRVLEARRAFVCAAALGLAAGAAHEARAGEATVVVRSLLPPGPQGAALRRAALGARRRLARQECQQVFSQFEDASGQPLQEKLDAQGQTAASYLGLILFADGAKFPRCQDPRVFALTEPGSRVVHVCGRQFASVESDNPRLTEAFLIHEELHSLGLRENPPSSKEITVRVLAACHP